MTKNSNILCLCLFICFLGFNSSAQIKSSNDKLNTESLIELLLKGESDSVLLQLEGLSASKGDTLDVIKRIAKASRVSISDLLYFIDMASQVKEPNFPAIVQFIEKFVDAPAGDKINIDYVNIKWSQTTIIRNELLDLEHAGKQNQELKDYINLFPESSPDKIRAEIIAATHDIVMKGIQQDVENGLAMTDKMEALARSINDTTLIIGSLYYRNDFLILQGKLEEYIQNCEKSYYLDSKSAKKSDFYLANFDTWINALIYQGGHDERVLRLLNEYFDASHNPAQTLTTIAQFLTNEPINSENTKQIYEKFKVSTPIELSQKFEEMGESRLNGLAFFHLLNQLGHYMHSKGLYDEARAFYGKSIDQIRNTYSKDLSKTIADYETDLVEREKQAELDAESEKTKLFIIIAVLASILLTLALFSLYRQRLTSNRLSKKNIEIRTQRDLISKKEKEKELLLNELHHRVKNNFQVIINLLTLQSISLGDQKAKALIDESLNRVKSMAFVHGKLVTSDTMQVDFDVYLNELVAEISNSFKTDIPVKIEIKADGIQFNVDTAIPLGLIVNELATNAFKYGFTSDSKLLRVEIKRTTQGHYELIVSDNGPGLPEDFDFTQASSLGLKLVKGLAKQLGGELQIRKDGTSEFVILFQELQF